MSIAPVDIARPAAPDRYVVLDGDDRIEYVAAGLHEPLGRWLGHVLWDLLPASREVYGPVFDAARASGERVDAVVFYAGRAKRLTVLPAADGLAVHIEVLAALDVTSLGTLRRSLERIESALAAPASAPHDPPARASLRALP